MEIRVCKICGDEIHPANLKEENGCAYHYLCYNRAVEKKNLVHKKLQELTNEELAKQAIRALICLILKVLCIFIGFRILISFVTRVFGE